MCAAVRLCDVLENEAAFLNYIWREIVIFLFLFVMLFRIWMEIKISQHVLLFERSFQETRLCAVSKGK